MKKSSKMGSSKYEFENSLDEDLKDTKMKVETFKCVLNYKIDEAYKEFADKFQQHGTAIVILQEVLVAKYREYEKKL